MIYFWCLNFKKWSIWPHHALVTPLLALYRPAKRPWSLEVPVVVTCIRNGPEWKSLRSPVNPLMMQATSALPYLPLQIEVAEKLTSIIRSRLDEDDVIDDILPPLAEYAMECTHLSPPPLLSLSSPQPLKFSFSHRSNSHWCCVLRKGDRSVPVRLEWSNGGWASDNRWNYSNIRDSSEHYVLVSVV